MPIIQIKGYLCNRCEHKWTSRNNSKDLPVVCPLCKSPYWNTTKVGT